MPNHCASANCWASLRHWFPVILSIFAYREMGWFAQPALSTELEDSWIVWDKLLLNEWGLKAAIEKPGTACTIDSGNLLLAGLHDASDRFGHFVYRKRSELANAFLFNFLLGVLAVYALFPYFPSEPPGPFSPARFPSLQYNF